MPSVPPLYPPSSTAELQTQQTLDGIAQEPYAPPPRPREQKLTYAPYVPSGPPLYPPSSTTEVIKSEYLADVAPHQPDPTLVNRKYILHDYIHPPGFASYRFRFLVNPRTRSPQFGHLKDATLYEKIRDLPRWQQLQKTSPWFRPIDVLLMYFVDVEALVVSTVRDFNIHSNFVAWTSKAIGYADELVFRDGRRNSSVERVESDVPKVLHIIKGHKPRTQPPLPSGLEEITIRIAGLIDRSYRLINQAIPPAMKSAAAPSLRLPTVENTCITAKMEFFHNEGERKRLNTKLYSRLRASYPKNKP